MTVDQFSFFHEQQKKQLQYSMTPFRSLKLKNLLIGGFPASADKQNAAYIPQKQFRYSLSYSNVRLQAGRLDDQPSSLRDKCHLKRNDTTALL